MEEKSQELSAHEKAVLRLENLKQKKLTIYFFVPTIKEVNASTIEIYTHASVMKKAGYKVVMIVDSEEYAQPFYIDKELLDVEHYILNSVRLDIAPEDVIVIPEIYTNVMEQTMNVPATRIVLCQSIDYMYNALLPASSWADFGIENVITTSDRAKKYIETAFPSRFDIQTYTIGIPSYFKSWDKPKRPIVSFMTRNPNDMNKIAKDFYAKYPFYSFVMFDTMYTETKPQRQTTRKEFAEKLSKNFAAVWVDRISTFGTFPLECIASGTIPICVVPDFDPPYILDENGKYIEEGVGFWTTSIYQVSDLLGKLVSAYLDDGIEDSVYNEMNKVAAKHSPEISEKSIIQSYQYFIDQRIELLDGAINKSKETNE